MFLFLTFLLSFFKVFCLRCFRLRERILQQGFVENGHVLEVLPPSGEVDSAAALPLCNVAFAEAQSKGERWFMLVVDGIIKNSGSSGAKIAACKVRSFCF